jgi:predicted DNA-binding protein with PD1-like motif
MNIFELATENLLPHRTYTPMLSKIEGNDILVKMEKGEEILPTLSKVVEKYGVSSGTVVFGIGMIKNLEVGYFNGKEYEKKVYPENLETLSFHGSIAENEPRFHIHASCANRDHNVVGGHLFSGMADPLLEIQIRKLDEVKFRREKNQKSGLMELTL